MQHVGQVVDPALAHQTGGARRRCRGVISLSAPASSSAPYRDGHHVVGPVVVRSFVAVLIVTPTTRWSRKSANSVSPPSTNSVWPVM